VSFREGLTFDDVLLVPQHSNLPSRDCVSLDVKLADVGFCHPIIPANMEDVTTAKMAQAQARTGGLAILHRFSKHPLEVYDWTVSDLPMKWRVGVSLGVHETDRELFKQYRERGVHFFCVDTAHGDSDLSVEMVTWLRSQDRKIGIIAGNVATSHGALRLWKAGADVVKVGVGPGSLCTTRIETGNGVPQLTALMDVHEARQRYASSIAYQYGGTRRLYIIADGGIGSAGDCVKALCFADMVMCGRLFAGCDECGFPNPENGLYKQYRGSSTHKSSHIEGVIARVPCAGPYEGVLAPLLDGIRSGCSYQGVALVPDLQKEPQLIRQTHAGLRESYPHDVVVVRDDKK